MHVKEYLREKKIFTEHTFTFMFLPHDFMNILQDIIIIQTCLPVLVDYYPASNKKDWEVTSKLQPASL